MEELGICKSSDASADARVFQTLPGSLRENKLYVLELDYLLE